MTTYIVTNFRYDEAFWTALISAVLTQQPLPLDCEEMTTLASPVPVTINTVIQRVSNDSGKFEGIGISDHDKVCRLEENNGTLYLDVF